MSTQIDSCHEHQSEVCGEICPWQVIEGRIEDVRKGDTGTTFTPHLSPNGTLSWTNNGGLENPEPVNIAGKDGVTPNISAEVKTGAPGTEAKVEQSGDVETPKLIFTIPRGDTGAPFLIKGAAFADLEELQNKVPDPAEGDQYNVGAAPPYLIYRWTGKNWENQGSIGSGVRSWTVTVPASAWVSDSDTFMGDAMNVKAEISAEGVTPETDLDLPLFIAGDYAAYITWRCYEAGDGVVIFKSSVAPAADFSVKFTEVK